jgi:hypothetical protein
VKKSKRSWTPGRHKKFRQTILFASGHVSEWLANLAKTANVPAAVLTRHVVNELLAKHDAGREAFRKAITRL